MASENGFTKAFNRFGNVLTHNKVLRDTAKKINEELSDSESYESFAMSGARMLNQILDQIYSQAIIDSKVTPQSFLIRLKREGIENSKNDPLLIISSFEESDYGNIYSIENKGGDNYLISLKVI